MIDFLFKSQDEAWGFLYFNKLQRCPSHPHPPGLPHYFMFRLVEHIAVYERGPKSAHIVTSV